MTLARIDEAGLVVEPGRDWVYKALRTVENSPTFRVIRSRHRLISPEEFGTTP